MMKKANPPSSASYLPSLSSKVTDTPQGRKYWRKLFFFTQYNIFWSCSSHVGVLVTEYLDLSLTLSSQASKAEDQIPSTSEQHGQTFLLEQGIYGFKRARHGIAYPNQVMLVHVSLTIFRNRWTWVKSPPLHPHPLMETYSFQTQIHYPKEQRVWKADKVDLCNKTCSLHATQFSFQQYTLCSRENVRGRLERWLSR